ncbi:MAG: branched-chain amino acid ABC transporter permease [Chloroflexi bacterium]|nr:branched-chain amino acid ABC transporter permease [Chloroflexota bacterium]
MNLLLIRRNFLYLAFLALLIAFPFALALFTGEAINKGTPLFAQGLMIQLYILAVFALSYDILMGHIGILSFGHALFFGTGAYTLGILVKYGQWNLLAALGAVVVIAAVESLLIGVLSLRVHGVYFAMVTLAFATVAHILVGATDFRQWTGAEDGLHGIPVPDIVNPTLHRLEFYYLALAFAVIVYLLVRRFVDSPSGRVWAAIRENEARAVSIGYNTLLFKVQATIISGILAALAGALYAMWNRSATPQTMDVNTTINALLMAIIGGSGTLIGPMLGAGVLELLGYILNAWLGSIWQLVFGVIYVLLVLFLPYGLVGTWRARNASWRAMWNEQLARWAAMLKGDKQPQPHTEK